MPLLPAACQCPGAASRCSGCGAPAEYTYSPEQSMQIVFLHRVHHIVYSCVYSCCTHIHMLYSCMFTTPYIYIHIYIYIYKSWCTEIYILILLLYSYFTPLVVCVFVFVCVFVCVCVCVYVCVCARWTGCSEGHYIMHTLKFLYMCMGFTRVLLLLHLSWYM
jgi:hypothetical protein